MLSWAKFSWPWTQGHYSGIEKLLTFRHHVHHVGISIGSWHNTTHRPASQLLRMWASLQSVYMRICILAHHCFLLMYMYMYVHTHIRRYRGIANLNKLQCRVPVLSHVGMFWYVDYMYVCAYNYMFVKLLFCNSEFCFSVFFEEGQGKVSCKSWRTRAVYSTADKCHKGHFCAVVIVMYLYM